MIATRPGHVTLTSVVTQTSSTLTGAIDVLVDESGRLGALAYLLPDGVEVAAGDAVTVPFGIT